MLRKIIPWKKKRKIKITYLIQTLPFSVPTRLHPDEVNAVQTK